MKIIKNSYVQFVLILVVSLGLLIGFFTLTSSQIADNAHQREVKTYAKLLPGLTDFRILEDESFQMTLTSEIIEGINDKQERVGLIFTGAHTNAYGSIEMRVAVDLAAKITGAMFVDYGQSAFLQAKSESNLKRYLGTTLGTTLTTDSNGITAGATSSLNSLNAMMEEFRTLFNQLSDPLTAVFGPHTIEEDSSGISGIVVKKEKIMVEGSVAGYRYTFEKEGSFDAGGTTKTGIIGIQIVYKLDGTIISFVTDKYTHTTTQRRPKINAFLETFVGTKVADLVITANAGKSSVVDIDATYSVNLVLDMIETFHNDVIVGGNSND